MLLLALAQEFRQGLEEMGVDTSNDTYLNTYAPKIPGRMGCFSLPVRLYFTKNGLSALFRLDALGPDKLHEDVKSTFWVCNC